MVFKQNHVNFGECNHFVDKIHVSCDENGMLPQLFVTQPLQSINQSKFIFWAIEILLHLLSNVLPA